MLYQRPDKIGCSQKGVVRKGMFNCCLNLKDLVAEQRFMLMKHTHPLPIWIQYLVTSEHHLPWMSNKDRSSKAKVKNKIKGKIFCCC